MGHLIETTMQVSDVASTELGHSGDYQKTIYLQMPTHPTQKTSHTERLTGVLYELCAIERGDQVTVFSEIPLQEMPRNQKELNFKRITISSPKCKVCPANSECLIYERGTKKPSFINFA